LLSVVYSRGVIVSGLMPPVTLTNSTSSRRSSPAAFIFLMAAMVVAAEAQASIPSSSNSIRCASTICDSETDSKVPPLW
jgi:hypothetical protein